MISEELPSAQFWKMEDIPVGSGSAGTPQFNMQIEDNMNWCTTVLGICDEKCASSHKEWGSPAEWRMGLNKQKTVVVLYLDGELEKAMENETVEALSKCLQFAPIPPDLNP